MIENNTVTLPLEEAKELLVAHKESDHFVATTFKGLYYSDEENDLIDTLRTNIAAMRDQYNSLGFIDELQYRKNANEVWRIVAQLAEIYLQVGARIDEDIRRKKGEIV